MGTEQLVDSVSIASFFPLFRSQFSAISHHFAGMNAPYSMNTSLPPGWEMRWDPTSQRNYYVNHVEKRTQWEPPMAAPPPVNPAAFQPRPAQMNGQSSAGFGSCTSCGSAHLTAGARFCVNCGCPVQPTTGNRPGSANPMVIIAAL